MTKRNPYKITAKVLRIIGYSLLALVIIIPLGIAQVLAWEESGAWSLLMFPGFIAAGLSIIGLGALIALIAEFIQRKWRNAARKWDDKNRYKKF